MKKICYRDLISMICLLGVVLAFVSCQSLVNPKNKGSRDKPNIIVFFVDDLGYNDLGCYGARDPGIKTPNIDRMAAEGIRFTDSFSACSVCAPSRAAFLTGRYPMRCGMPNTSSPGAIPEWQENIGLQQSEVTIAEVLKQRGYATAWYGKSHLGHVPKFLPLRHGFDEYYGSLNNFPVGTKGCTILEGDEIVERNVQYETIHEKMTQRTIDFMVKNQNEEKPFFVYLAHYLVHGPWVPNRQFATDEEWASYMGKKQKGEMNPKVYPAMVRELDWHVGKVLDKLKELGLDENTIVVFTSDNGPWLPAGSAWPLRGAKFNTWEGGNRVPSIIRWPGKIPSGQVCDKLTSTMDLLPTLASAAGAEIPKDRVLDGKNIWPLLSGEKDAKSPHHVLYYYNGTRLEVVREGKWKLHLAREQASQVDWLDYGGESGGAIVNLDKPILFDLSNDIGEKNDVANQYPEVVERLLDHAEKARGELGDWNRKGTDQKTLLNYKGNANRPERFRRR